MIEWKKFDYKNKADTRPPHGDLVWVTEDLYEEGVTLGYFDGFTFRTWSGSDDCKVSWWGLIDYPGVPEGYKYDEEDDEE